MPAEYDLDGERIERSLSTETVGRRVVYLAETTSTMDVAHREARAGAPEGTVVIAEEQTAGRGRFSRAWVTTAGKNLTYSVVLRPDLAGMATVNMAACLSVVRAVRTVTGLAPKAKWPNDVRIGDRKLCGILVESELERERPAYMVVGIGVNVNFDPTPYPEIAATATSLLLETGGPVSRLDLCRELLTELDILCRTRPEDVWQEWRGALETIGRRVQVRWGDTVDEGLAVDVDRQGSLVLKLDDGSLRTVVAGEVTLQV